MGRFDREPVVVNNTTNGGVGFVGALALIFIALKLTGLIAWSWWWVLSPLWIGLAFWIVIVAFILFLASVLSK